MGLAALPPLSSQAPVSRSVETVGFPQALLSQVPITLCAAECGGQCLATQHHRGAAAGLSPQGRRVLLRGAQSTAARLSSEGAALPITLYDSNISLTQ